MATEDNTRRTLLNISSAALEDGVVCRWVLESRAEERSKDPVLENTQVWQRLWDFRANPSKHVKTTVCQTANFGFLVDRRAGFDCLG